MSRNSQHRPFCIVWMIGWAAMGQLLSGCFNQVRDQAPATVHFQRFEIEVPQARLDIMELSASDDDDLLVVEFCNLQPAPTAMTDRCEPRDSALEGIRGFRTILSTPFVGLAKFQNRPTVMIAPQRVPLLMYSAAPEPNNSSDPEWYQFSRLRSVGAHTGPIMTTDAGWPLVHCEPRVGNHAWCTLGFQIEGAFVETSWTHVGPLTQAELWRIGSGIDAKIRQCIRPSIC